MTASTQTCPNCGAPISGPFCASCGQKIRPPDPTLREFVHDTTEELVHWDGKIPSTIKTLFLKPGELTRDFLQGRRARWLHPLRVYLICSIAYFASGPLVESLFHVRAKQAIRFGITADSGQILTPEDSAAIVNSRTFGWLGKERLNRLMKDPMGIQRQMNVLLPRAMFFLLPLFALLTNLAYRKVAPRYPAHLYFALHLHAAAFGALAIAKAGSAFGSVALDLALSILGVAFCVWWALRALRVVFGGSMLATVAKGAVIGLVYLLFNGLASVGLFVYTIL